jgi:transcriptional regulator with XRE-family HTH domain
MAQNATAAVPRLRQMCARDAAPMTQEMRAAGNNAEPGSRPALGEVLRALRLAGGISQEGWAARLGVGRRTVVRWEQGETVPDAAMEVVILAVCQERALFRAASAGLLRGITLTPELLRDLLAEARVASPRTEVRSPKSKTGDEQPPFRIPHAALRTLPVPLSSFIGREEEQAEVKRLLGTARLLTLTGTGGCGKTRLALEVARALEPSYLDGAWLVELAAIVDPVAVVPTVAAALGLREEPGRIASIWSVRAPRSPARCCLPAPTWPCSSPAASRSGCWGRGYGGCRRCQRPILSICRSQRH